MRFLWSIFLLFWLTEAQDSLQPNYVYPLSYPPIPVNASSFLVAPPASWYGHGEYSISSSDSNMGWRVFDGSASTFWSSLPVYPSNLYNGTSSSPFPNARGEWIQLRLPTAISLRSFKLSASLNQGKVPNSFLLLGANTTNGPFIPLLTVTNESRWSTAQSIDYNVLTAPPLTHFRLVISNATIGTGDSVAISEISLLGIDSETLILFLCCLH